MKRNKFKTSKTLRIASDAVFWTLGINIKNLFPLLYLHLAFSVWIYVIELKCLDNKNYAFVLFNLTVPVQCPPYTENVIWVSAQKGLKLEPSKKGLRILHWKLVVLCLLHQKHLQMIVLL